MTTNKAITVCSNYLQWSNYIKYEELNTPLFQLALEYLITLAQEIEKEGNGLDEK